MTADYCKRAPGAPWRIVPCPAHKAEARAAAVAAEMAYLEEQKQNTHRDPRDVARSVIGVRTYAWEAALTRPCTPCSNGEASLIGWPPRDDDDDPADPADAAIEAAGDGTVYCLEHYTPTLGLWTALQESTERTGFRMDTVWYPSAEAAEECRREMIAIGWDPHRLRVASRAKAGGAQ